MCHCTVKQLDQELLLLPVAAACRHTLSNSSSCDYCSINEIIETTSASDVSAGFQATCQSHQPLQAGLAEGLLMITH
jgi:hypothetical protein